MIVSSTITPAATSQRELLRWPKMPIAKLARRVIDRYELELVNHFEIEEQVLFPAAQELQQTPVPALPQALSNDFVPSAGPDIDGMTLWGSSSPKTLFRVARFAVARPSTRGR